MKCCLVTLAALLLATPIWTTARPLQPTPEAFKPAALERLDEAIERYTEIVDAGGWPALPDEGLAEVGDTTDRVRPLRERLAATGDLTEEAAGRTDAVYDEGLAQSVRRFQRRHGLAVDGVLGPNTVAALNVPAERRLAQLRRNRDRLDTLPDDMGARFVFVNVPEFRLRAFDAGDEVLQMKVVVGAEYDGRQTPTFDDQMEYVVFSPYWNVPDGIAREEIVPKAREDRAFLAENHYQIVSNWGPHAEVYDRETASLDRVASGDYKIRQSPGPHNALGLVKFMFPNSEAIYLHGTPADHLFDEPTRAFSHGCIRVERPVELARFVLQDQPTWTEEKIRTAMHDGTWQRVDLEATLPVYLLYLTAFVDDDGGVQFREDLYDRLEG